MRNLSILFCFAVFAASALADDITIRLKAGDFKRSGKVRIKKVRDNEILVGGGRAQHAVTVPQSGIYELGIFAGASWPVRILVNDKCIEEIKPNVTGLTLPDKQDEVSKIGNIRLNKGQITLGVETGKHPGLPRIYGLILKKRNVPQASVIGKLPGYKCYYRKGGKVAVKISADALDKNYVVKAVIERKDKSVLKAESFTVQPNSRTIHKTITLPLDFTGEATLRLLANGADAMRPAPLMLFDPKAKAVMGKAWPQEKLTQTIDCVKKQPDFSGYGKPKVVTSAAGTYLESGDKGVAPDGANYSSYMAWRMDTPKIGQLYKVEVDYPDDQVREFTISVMDDSPWVGSKDVTLDRPISGGVASGAEYRNFNTIDSQSIYFVARRPQTTLFMLNWVHGVKIGIKSIRLYEVDGKFPDLKTASPQIRSQAMYNEEPDRWISYFGGLSIDIPQTVKAFENYADWCRTTGADTIWETVTIYGKSTWYSKQLPAFRLTGNYRVKTYPTGILRLMLMTAEKYDLKFIAELHPSIYAITGLDKTKPGVITHSAERKEIYNVFHPDVREWAKSLVCDLVRQGSFSPAFKGVSIRWTGWQNAGWAMPGGGSFGLDDWTLRQFCSDQNINFKIFSCLNKAKRWNLLSRKYKTQWKTWKNNKIQTFYRDLAKSIQAIDPESILFLYLVGIESDVDLERLDGIPGIKLTTPSMAVNKYPRARMYKKLRDASTLNPEYAFMSEKPFPFVSPLLMFANLYMETSLKLSKAGIKAKRRTSFNPCGVLSPPGRAFLERYANALRTRKLPEMIIDGGLGYVQGDAGYRREFAGEFLPLPKIKYTRMDNADPVTLWQGEKDGKTFFYLVNGSNAQIEAKIKTRANQIQSLSNGKKYKSSATISLPPFALRSFSASAPIKSFAVTIDDKTMEYLQKQLSDAKRILAMRNLKIPEIINCSPQDYKLGLATVRDAEKALKEGRIIKFRRLLRSSMKEDRRKIKTVLGLYKVFNALNEYPYGMYNVDKEEKKHIEKTQSALPAGIKLIRTLKDSRKSAGKLLYAMIGKDKRKFFLFDDAKILVYKPDGNFERTLHLAPSQAKTKSFTIHKNHIMLSNKTEKISAGLRKFIAAKNRSNKKTFPYSISALHKTPDNRVAYLYSNKPQNRHFKLYAVTPVTTPEVIHPGNNRPFVNDFCFADGKVYYSGMFQKGGKLCMVSFPLSGNEREQTIIPAGKGKQVTLCGPIQAQTGKGIIMRQVVDGRWTGFQLVHLKPDGNTSDFFDFRSHYKKRGKFGLYTKVKQFPPWGLVFRMEAYPNDGYALIVEPMCSVFRLDKHGKVRWVAGVLAERGGQKIEFKSLQDGAVDSQGRLWLVDADTSLVHCLDKDGKELFRFGHPARESDQSGAGLWKPGGIETIVDNGTEYLYIADTGNKRILEYELGTEIIKDTK